MFSSPICHDGYLRVREELLGNILHHQYDGLLPLPEGIAAIRSKNLRMSTNKEQAIALLDSWRRSEEISTLALTSGPRPNEPASSDEVIDLFNLHKEITFFLEDYSTHATLPPWVDPDQWPTELMPLRLSHAERRRFARALCRLYLHANIFGNIEMRESSTDWTGNNWEHTVLDTEDAWRLFFGTLPPWEYEELVCVWSYFMTRYEPVIEEISEGLRDRGVHFFWDLLEEEKPPGESVTIETVDDLEHFPGCVDSLVSLGPGFLYRVLNAAPRRRRDMVLLNASFSIHTWIGEKVCMAWDDKLPLIFPADRYYVQSFEELWSRTTPNDGPNAAWKNFALEDHQKGVPFEAAFVGSESLCRRGDEREWGYAIWDDERLRGWNALFLNKGDDPSVD